MKKQNIRRSLLLSALSLVMCISMLIGTTFAWFTDSVQSGINKIQAGNLDIELYHGKSAPTNKVGENTDDIFTDANGKKILWEPGVVAWTKLKVINEGSLALKYQLAVNFANASSVNVDGETYTLVDALKVAVVDASKLTDREAAIAAGNEATWKTLTRFVENGELYAEDDTTGASEKIYGIVIYWEPSAKDNIFNMNNGKTTTTGGKELTIDLGIHLAATQLTAESDSFNNQYDKDAELPIDPAILIKSTAELEEKLKTATPGTKLYMAAGTFDVDAPLNIPNGVSIYGVQKGIPAVEWANDPQAEKTVFKSEGGNVFQILQTSEKVEEAVGNITIDGIMIEGGNKGIYVKKSDGEAMENIKIVNCAVINSANNGIEVRNVYGAVIENNYVSNVKDTAICLGNYNGYHYETWAEVTAYVRNNVIEDVTGTANGAIMLDNGMGDVVVKGNIIKNLVSVGSGGISSDIKASAILVYDVYEGGEILIAENELINVDQGIAVYKYTTGIYYGESWWEGPTTDNDSVVIKDNTINEYTTFAIKTSNLNEEGSAAVEVVTISGNTITTTGTAAAIETDEASDKWSVVLSGNTLNGAAIG